MTITIPAIKTAALLAMSDGDTMDLGDGQAILCEDAYRRAFSYSDGFDTIPLAYNEASGTWISAMWNERNAQWTCGDLTVDGWSYAYARSLGALSGVRSYRSAGALIRAGLAR